MNRCRCIFNLVLFLMLILPKAGAGVARAQEKIDAPKLNALNLVEGSKELIDTAYSTWAQSVVKRDEGEDLIRKRPKLKKIAKSLGDSVVFARQTERAAETLIQMGEPAGKDLLWRARDVLGDLAQFRDSKYASVLGPLQQLAAQEKQRNAGYLAKSRSKIIALMAKNRPEEAELEYDRLFDTIGGWQFFLSDGEKNKLSQQFVDGYINSGKMKSRREDAFQRKLRERYFEMLPKFDELKTALSTKLDEFKKQGSNGASQESAQYGPNLIRNITESLQATHIQAYKALTISAIIESGEFTQNCNRIIEAIEKRYFESVIAILETDQKFSTSSSAEQLYFDYIKKLVPILLVTDDKSFSDKCNKLLLGIAVKSEGLVAVVDSYTFATSELLFWRNQVANEKMRRASRKSLPVAAVLRKRSDPKKLESIETKKGTTVPSKLKTGLNFIGPEADRLLVKQPALFNNLNYRGALGYVTLVDRHWARSSTPIEIQNQVDSLRHDLMSSKEKPPLSLKASMSLASANLKQFSWAGCTISKVQFESVADRVLNLPAKAQFMMPVGTDYGNLALDQVVMRLDIEPFWVQHDHFFVDLRKNQVSAAKESETNP